MSKLQELIKKLCPDGVEFRKLGEISNFRRGSFPQPYGNKEWYGGEGAMPFIQVADIEDNMQLAKKTKRLISRLAQPMSVFAPKESIIISLQGSIGRIAVTQYDAYIDRTVAIFTNISKNIIPKYFVYQLQSIFKIKEKTARGSTIKTITKEEFTNFEIPLPPLEVQKEIVRILDAFTAHTAELQAELQARKEQYEYYRNKLLNIPRGAILELKIGEIYEFKYGVGNKIPTNPGEYPVYGSNGIVGSYNMYNNEDAPVIGHIGAYAGIVNWAKGKHFVTYNGVICKCINNMVNHRYGYYLLLLQNYISKAKTGSQPFISYDILKEPVVRIPSLSEQQRIVSILDKFESLVNDLSEGLPAEIAAVQEQYEYYRNKLLTFKRKS